MYTISYPSGIIRLDGVIVPLDDSTPEYQAYVRFLQSGGGPIEIADQIEPPRRPHVTCSARQLRKALNERSLRQQVEDYVASQDQNTRDDYEFATVWESDNVLLLETIPQLGWTEDAVYELIAYASTLQ